MSNGKEREGLEKGEGGIRQECCSVVEVSECVFIRQRDDLTCGHGHEYFEGTYAWDTFVEVTTELYI